MNKFVRIALIIFLFGLLVAIRGFLTPFFYDPLAAYFKSNYLQTPIPVINFSEFFLNIFYRYFLNSSISLLIIYLIFKDKNSVVFSMKFYVFAFLVLCVFLFLLLKFPAVSQKMLIFYVRRFLIQPLFVFILLPAFYYQKLKKGN